MDNVWETFKLIIEGVMRGAAGQGIQVFLALIIMRRILAAFVFVSLCERFGEIRHRKFRSSPISELGLVS